MNKQNQNTKQRLEAQMCTQKGAEILANQSVAVSAASHNQNLNEGQSMREKTPFMFDFSFPKKKYV